MKPDGERRFRRETADERRRSLVEAAVKCLARGGMAAFTVEQVSAAAKVSRGLINHHFGSMDNLLAAVYRQMTGSMEAAGLAALTADGGPEARLKAVLETMFAPPMFSREALRAWLALWGEAAANPALRRAHRKSYDAYRRAMAGALSEIAIARKRKLDALRLATATIALIDGLWIEWCLDPSVISRQDAREAVYAVLEAALGRLQR